jgi:D-alanyl-D-alanine carboxypeptidase
MIRCRLKGNLPVLFWTNRFRLDSTRLLNEKIIGMHMSLTAWNTSMHLCLRLGPPRLPILLSIVLLSLPGISATAQSARTQSALKEADAYIASQTAKNNFRGAVLVSIDGNIAFEKGYGFANQEWGALNTPNTEYRIFSITKQFTGACILLLEERGLLNVQDPISKYVDGLPESWKSITLHQLSTHTSGIPNYPDMTPRAKELERLHATPREMLEIAATKPLEFKPGTQLHYSNTGYILLGMVIEKISGQTYAEFLKKNIFDPIGMAHSGYDDQEAILPNRASGYSIRDGQAINATFGDMSYPFSAGGIYSTVEDMKRWCQAITTSGALLKATSLRQMFAIYSETAAYGEQNYGYGVVIAHKFGKLLHYHGGGWYDFGSILQEYPQEHLCIIVLANTDRANLTDIADHVAAALFGQPPPIAK